MFTVYHSNQLDVLKSLLAHLMTRQPLSSPFAAEQILVQSPGMAQWLKQALASELGVMANVTFPLPSSFMWQMFHQVLPEVPKENPYVKPAMLWRLMSLLPALSAEPAFAVLAQYLAEDVDGRRCYQLCQRIADLFDQYLVYRPDWIVDWEAGGTLGAEQHPWQPELWRRLVTMTEQQASHLHRVNLFTQFIATLENSKNSVSLPERVFIFGISSLPPHYLEALAALGKRCDVHLLLTNPCQLYWGDIQEAQQMNRRLLEKLLAKQRASLNEGEAPVPLLPADHWHELFSESGEQQGNPLLVSMGKQGRDYLALLAEIESAEVDAFVDVPADSMLHQLQRDLLTLQDGTQRTEPFVLAADDDSFAVHGCHSPLREVEVLHDQLLHYFEQDPTLTPKDIIVMVSDINHYGPYIQAVFSSVPESRFIPFSISDRAATQENPLLQSFLTLLALPTLRCTAAELLDVLAVPALLHHFSLEEADVALLRDWVQDSGIRWGVAAEDGQRFDLPPRERHTWQFGLERMLLGFATGDLSLFAGIAPYTAIEGQQAEKLGQLTQFIEQILELRRTLEQPASITAWVNRVDTLLLQFYMPEDALEDEDADALRLIRSVMQAWQSRLLGMMYAAEIPLSVFQDHVRSELTAVRGGQRFLSGRVNFCTLMPMRAIPFRLVCLLGMNDGWYPRSMPPLGFDLMVGQSRRGDRSRREDDRYLFLEAILAAQDRLYISYLAHSIQDNRDMMPSVLVTELLEYCQRSSVVAGDDAEAASDREQAVLDRLVRDHPLVPYDRRYFTTGDAENSAVPVREPWFSYASEWLPALQPKNGGDFLHLPDTGDSALEELTGEQELVSLQRFCRHPLAGFFQRRLNVSLVDYSSELEDWEPFWPDALERYQLRDRLLQILRQQISPEQWRPRLLAEGSLPEGAFGELALDDELTRVLPLFDALSDWPLSDASRLPFSLELLSSQERKTSQEHKPTRLMGLIGGVYQQQLVRYRVSRLKANWLVPIWLEHLALCASEQLQQATHLLTLEQKGLWQAQWPVFRAEEASTLLESWWQFYQHAYLIPCCAAWETGWAWMTQVCGKDKIWPESLDQEKRDQAWQSAERIYLGDEFNGAGEGGDPYYQRCFPQLTQSVRAEIEQWAETLLWPMYRLLEVQDHE